MVEDGIVVFLCTRNAPIVFPSDEEFIVEDLCIQVARQCHIGPIARHLCSLRRRRDGKTWYSSCERICASRNERIEVDFRIRFKVPCISRLQHIDCSALDYYFHQVRKDFLNGEIPEAHNKGDALGLAATDMLRVTKEENKHLEDVERDYKAFLPQDVYRMYGFGILISKWIKQALHASLEGLMDFVQDVSFIKAKYIQRIWELAPSYGQEEFDAMIDEAGHVSKVQLQVNPFLPDMAGLRLYKSKHKEWQLLCTIEELCFISMRIDRTVEISRRNGVPLYLQFNTEAVMHSLVSALDGYYRLMEKWTFNLCKDMLTPSLVELRSNKCHGPAGFAFSFRKLQEKRQNKPGSYILREGSSYDTYRLDVCLEGEEHPKTFGIAYSKEEKTYQLQECTIKFESISKLLSYLQKQRNGMLVECVPPSEYDKSELLICRVENTDAISSVDENSSLPVCISPSRLTFEKIIHRSYCQCGTFVRKATFQRTPTSKFIVAVKMLEKATASKMQEFMEVAGNCLYWHCDAIVTLHGFCLTNPLALVMEYHPHGSLDKYLKSHQESIQDVDLIESATYLAKALWYLEEQRIVHGNIRCRNLLLVDHQENSFKVKLGDPGIPNYGEDQIHWISPECYHEFKAVRKSLMADVWAFGTTLWEIFSYGETPLNGIPIHEVFLIYKSGAILQNPPKCHKDIYQLMKECWIRDPDVRKKPQAIMRDINQILYEVYNSRRIHSYAKVNYTGSPTSSSQDSLSSRTTAVLSTCHIHANGDDDFDTDASHGACAQPEKWGLSILEKNDCDPSATPSYFATSSNGFHHRVNEDKILWCITSSQLELGEKLGQGFYGEVRKGKLRLWDEAEEDVAVKQLKMRAGEIGTEDFLKEITIMKRLTHTNIVKIKGVVEDPETLLVMEYVPLGSLLVFIRTQKEHYLKDNHNAVQQLLKFAMDIAEGMEYLGQQRIVHRDLAARNILVESDNLVKICDFGLAQIMDENDYYKLKTHRNLPIRWYAQEIFRTWRFTHKSDVWSYGVTLWEMFSYGEEPIIDGCEDEELVKILESGRRLGCPNTCPVRIYSHLMMNCWKASAEQRPSFTQILDEIRSLRFSD